MFVIDGNKVKVLREKSIITQMTLAAAAGTTPSYISTIETAESGRDCSVDFAMRLAKALGTERKKVSIEDLLTEI
jgi:DNA-binding XRE family transcriptional regulator